MDSDFLKQEIGLFLDRGIFRRHQISSMTGAVKSRYISALTHRVNQLEGKQTENLNEIKNKNNDLGKQMTQLIHLTSSSSGSGN